MPDIFDQIHAEQGGGDIFDQIHAEHGNTITSAPPQPIDPEWAGQHPNLYGVYGAANETTKKVGNFFGMDKITDPIARIVAHTLAQNNAEREGIGTPTGGELASSGLNMAALLLPYGKIAGGVTKGATKILPEILPRAIPKAIGAATAGAAGGYMVDAGDKLLRGEAPTPGMTTALGAIIPGGSSIVASAGKAVREYLPPRIMNSLVKPLLKDFSYGKNPGRVLAEEKVVANSFDDLVSKISEKRQEIGQKLGDVSDILSQSGHKVSISHALAPIDFEIQKAQAMPRTNTTLINRLQDLKNDILGVVDVDGQEVATRQLNDLTFNDALDIKRLIGDITKWTGNASDDKAVNSALKKVYGTIKNMLNKEAVSVNPRLAGEYAKLNEKYADITSADIAARYRDKISERLDLVGLKGHVGALGGGIAAVVTSGGSVVPTMIATASGAALDKALGSTAVKTRVASWLAKASPEEKNIVYRAAPRLAEAIDRAFGIKTRFPGDIIADHAGRPLSFIKTKLGEQRGGFSSEPLVTNEAAPFMERRTDLTKRKQVAEMTPEEMQTALLTDEKTGLGNERAVNEWNSAPVYGYSDLDGFKWINDAFGHEAGDAILKAKGRYQAEEFGTENAARKGGDEFVTKGMDRAAMEAAYNRVKAKLANTTFVVRDIDTGEVLAKVKGVEYSHGIGGSLNEAESAQAVAKSTRKAAGLRGGRGGKPQTVVYAGEGEGAGYVEAPYSGNRSPEQVKADYLKGHYPEPESSPVEIFKQQHNLSDQDILNILQNHVKKR